MEEVEEYKQPVLSLKIIESSSEFITKELTLTASCLSLKECMKGIDFLIRKNKEISKG